MKYQITNPNEKILEYCNKHNIKAPRKDIIISATDDEGNICGIIGLKVEYFIEPLIADSGVIANNLFRMIDGCILIKGLKNVRCITDINYQKLFEKVGFNLIENNKLIMEKDYGREQ